MYRKKNPRAGKARGERKKYDDHDSLTSPAPNTQAASAAGWREDLVILPAGQRVLMISRRWSATACRIELYEAPRSTLKVAMARGAAAGIIQIFMLVPKDVAASGAIPLHRFLSMIACDNRIALEAIAIENESETEAASWLAAILLTETPAGHA